MTKRKKYWDWSWSVGIGGYNVEPEGIGKLLCKVDTDLEGLNASIEDIWQRDQSVTKPRGRSMPRMFEEQQGGQLDWGSEPKKADKREGQRGDDVGIKLLVSSSLSWL